MWNILPYALQNEDMIINIGVAFDLEAYLTLSLVSPAHETPDS